MDRKTKYLGFRLHFNDYVKTIEAAQKAGVSITDFILSLLSQKINQKTDSIISLEKPKKESAKNEIESKQIDGKNESYFNSEEMLMSAKKQFEEINNLKYRNGNTNG